MEHMGGAAKDPRYQDSFKTIVKERDPSGAPSRTVEQGVISSDTLLENKDLRSGLQGLINRFSGAMKG